jgi:hypothetical protein
MKRLSQWLPPNEARRLAFRLVMTASTTQHAFTIDETFTNQVQRIVQDMSNLDHHMVVLRELAALLFSVAVTTLHDLDIDHMNVSIDSPFCPKLMDELVTVACSFLPVSPHGAETPVATQLAYLWILLKSTFFIVRYGIMPYPRNVPMQALIITAAGHAMHLAHQTWIAPHRRSMDPTTLTLSENLQLRNLDSHDPARLQFYMQHTNTVVTLHELLTAPPERTMWSSGHHRMLSLLHETECRLFPSIAASPTQRRHLRRHRILVRHQDSNDRLFKTAMRIAAIAQLKNYYEVEQVLDVMSSYLLPLHLAHMAGIWNAEIDRLYLDTFNTEALHEYMDDADLDTDIIYAELKPMLEPTTPASIRRALAHGVEQLNGQTVYFHAA